MCSGCSQRGAGHDDPLTCVMVATPPPNPWQRLLEAVRLLWTVSPAIGEWQGSWQKARTEIESAVKALEGVSVPTMPAPAPTLADYGRAVKFEFHPTPVLSPAGETASLSESQKRLGLRESRFVNKTPYDCDVDD